MDCTFSDLAQRVHTGRLDPKAWTWCVDMNPVLVEGRYVSRACIFVMGDGSSQCEAMVVLREGTTLAEAKTIVHEAFGVERVLIGVG